MPAHARAWLALLLSSAATAYATAPPTASTPTSPDGPLLGGLRQYLGVFTPASGEGSLLAYARRETLDWGAFQNLFAWQTTTAGYLDWRGHSATPAGSVFTTLRAATYVAGSRTLLVVNREWCAAGSCQARTAFGWLGAGTLKTVKDATVIPLIRDADFYAGPVPPCLKGVTLDVTYVPARQGTVLTALAVVPRAAQQVCAQAGVAAEATTRPLRLNWTVGGGKFRAGW